MSKHISTAVTTVSTAEANVANVYKMFGGPRASEYGPAQFGRAKWDGMVLEAEQLVTAVIKGRKPVYLLKEAMSTSLFPMLFVDGLDRKMLGHYTAAPTTWRNYVRRETVSDFRKVDRLAMTGMRGLLTEVQEGTPHDERNTEEKKYTFRVRRLEGGFSLTFEDYINDDLGALADLPQDLSQSAIDTEEYEATRLWAGATGLNTDFFKTANKNLAPSNAPLTRDAVQAAITELIKRTDDKGNPISVTGIELVVGPGLKLTAEQIVNATNYVVRDGNGNETHISGNGISGNFRINTNLWLPKVATTNADTTWSIFASATSGRPALMMGFLRGFEEPALYEQIPDSRRIGGGESPWSFDHGSQRKKVVHILGGTTVDERMCYGSNGSGVA